MKKLFAFCVLALLLGGCSDKYVSLYQTAPGPEMIFRNDTITMREKDSLNINGAGVVWLHTMIPAHQMHIEYNDTSNGKVHFSYRGVALQNDWPVIVAGDSTSVFCSCDTPGFYAVDFYLTDQLGKTTGKQLIINCLANQKIKASLATQLIDSLTTGNWLYLFDASACYKPDGKIMSYHFSINGQMMQAATPVFYWTFHSRGTQTVSFYAVDDLGQLSDTINEQILIP